ncbi:MAG: hypothetical protein LKM32_04660 [Chiayiivirga sp.]|jgi:hypothetical protein|nr:hypothetical protein [Chiayiivirga sp.]MCI1728705.1 hypothetical protein [Chiayiivirga sp.]
MRSRTRCQRRRVQSIQRHRVLAVVGEELAQRGVLLRDLLRAFIEPAPHAAQDVDEGRQAMSRLRREIGARVEREQIIRGQEHGQRPAAAATRQGLMRELVDLVEVGAFLAVQLDVDEQRVHHLRRRRVLETLVRHHVAPVASRVADREQDRLALGPRPCQRFFAPRPPIDGIVAVLAQVEAGFFRQTVAHGDVDTRRTRRQPTAKLRLLLRRAVP